MVGQELTQHLQHMQKLLSTLMVSYQDYQSREKPVEKQQITLAKHMIYVLMIIVIIIFSTYMFSAFIIEARKFIHYIAVVQIILSIGLYIFFVKNLDKNSPSKKTNVQQEKENNQVPIFELDQLRFRILQELASSPIPQNYITPTIITKMLQLVESGMCITVDECLSHVKKEMTNKNHLAELEIIQYLQIHSYH
ncbi:hypothetical protein [Metabacillus litoralis]|uniref:hypothetical protein n=1 Tax=Metabacillus litoralis TaxID=152268 RepID=UPI001CFE7F2B|nr:hypothetical protein [Metabacillus litoralis]